MPMAATTKGSVSVKKVHYVAFLLRFGRCLSMKPVQRYEI